MVKNLIAIVVVVAIIAAALVYFYLPRGPITITMSGLQIAESSLSFFDKFFLPDGRMINVGWQCVKNETFTGCENLNVQQHHSGWYGSAYAFVGEKTGNENYLTKAKHIFTGRVTHPEGVGTLEECLTEDEELISHLKERGGKYSSPEVECVGSFIGFDEWRQISGNETFLEGMRKGADWLVETGKPSSSVFFRYLDIGKLARVYEITGDKKYLSEAERRFDLDRSVLQNETFLYAGTDGEVFFEYRCWIDWGVSQLYRATKNATYLQELETSAQKFEYSKHFAEHTDLGSLMYCATVLMNLYEDTGEQNYRDQAVATMQHIVENLWDSKFVPKYNGDNGFLTEQYTGELNGKTPLFTAYVIRELSTRFAETEFVVGETQ